MAQWLENKLLGRHYAAIEFFSSGNDERAALLLTEKKGTELLITSNPVYDSVAQLLDQNVKSPTVVIVNNRHILQKEVDTVDANDKKILHRAFPNLQSEEFYYEIWRKESVSIIAICRKSYVNELLTAIKGRFEVVSVCLGITPIVNITSFELPDNITTNTHELSLVSDENILRPNTVVAANYNINGLSIPNTHILSFSSILKLLLPSATTGNINELNLTLREDYRQSTFSSSGIKIGLGVVLTMLLINFLLFSHYFDGTAALNEQVALNRSGIEAAGKIKERIRVKEQKLNSFTSSASARSSLIINAIVKELPSSILLSEMVYNPLQKKIREGEVILTEESTITVNGTTLSNDAFTAWIEKTGKLKAVNDITISSFGKNSEGNTAFSIKIIIGQ